MISHSLSRTEKIMKKAEYQSAAVWHGCNLKQATWSRVSHGPHIYSKNHVDIPNSKDKLSSALEPLPVSLSSIPAWRLNKELYCELSKGPYLWISQHSEGVVDVGYWKAECGSADYQAHCGDLLLSTLITTPGTESHTFHELWYGPFFRMSVVPSRTSIPTILMFASIQKELHIYEGFPCMLQCFPIEH